jgi:hypothetical protein
MADSTTGACCICGAETTQRCSSRSEKGFDLFFCSREHQKLVRTFSSSHMLQADPFNSFAGLVRSSQSLRHRKIRAVLPHPRRSCSGEGSSCEACGPEERVVRRNEHKRAGYRRREDDKRTSTPRHCALSSDKVGILRQLPSPCTGLDRLSHHWRGPTYLCTAHAKRSQSSSVENRYR